MPYGIRVLLLSLLLLVVLPLQALETSLREELRTRIESIPEDQPLVAGSMPVPASAEVRAFYRDRLYAPGWVEREGSAPLADELLQAISDAERDAMNPADYHPEAVREHLHHLAADEPTGPGTLVDLELLLTGIWFQLGSDSLIGQLNPQAVDPDWMIQRPTADLRRRLEWALVEGRVYESLRWLLPTAEGYVGLRKALAEHRALREQGGFVRVPPGPALRLGTRDERVPLLRQRLRQTYELNASPVDDPEYFDDGLKSVVRHFQVRHGLADDGVVGPLTLAELNSPLEARIRQLKVNMERWRWLPHDPGDRFIMVNIAGFEMVVVEHGVPVMRQRVIVGRDYRQTPVFTGNMTYLVLNPSWEVPNSIAVRDILPEVRRNPDYLRRMDFRVLQGWGNEEREVDPEAVDWQQVSARQFPYRFRQMPGPLNALGRVKFMFPNRYAVYLHDTPARDLFHRPDRAFSSGCIRVEYPLELVDLLLEDSTRWTPEVVRQVLAGGAGAHGEPAAIHAGASGVHDCLGG